MKRKMNAKHFLIQFLDDGIIHMCTRNELKIKGNTILATWGKTYYVANIIYSSNNFNLLQGFYENIINNNPKIKIEKCSHIPTNKKEIQIISDYTINKHNETSDSEPYSSDDSIKDPNYEIQPEVSNRIDGACNELNDFKLSTDKTRMDNNIAYIKQSAAFDLEGKKYIATDQNYFSDNLNIGSVEQSHCGKTKKYFCMYCHKLVTKFARHIEAVHKTEKDIQHILLLAKGKLFAKNIMLVICILKS